MRECVAEIIVQELCESRGGRPGLSVLTSLLVSYIESCFGIGLSLSVICQPTSEDIKQHYRPAFLMLKRFFTSMETVGLLGTAAQDGHLYFHTAPGL